jgi:hypothetical protein
MARHESEETQHSELVPPLDGTRFLVGREEERISINRDWNSGFPICGVVFEIAPGGLQSVKPSAQSLSDPGDVTHGLMIVRIATATP